MLIAFYAASLFISFHYFFVVYINSLLLESKVGEGSIGLFYLIGSLITIGVFVSIAPILRRYGNYRTLLTFATLEGVALLLLAFGEERALVVAGFILHQAVAALLWFCLDVLLETYSKDLVTGRLRAIYLTVANVALIFSLFSASSLAQEFGTRPVYIASFLMLIPFVLIMRSSFRNFKDPSYETPKIWNAFFTIGKSRNIRNIFTIGFLLQLFYGFMVIYLPVYLRNYMEFSWQEIGVILTVMVLPFLLFELFLGFIADLFWGEREIMIIGFFIMAVATMVLSFLAIPAVTVFATVLFMTRVGASFVEIMSETYFFKHVSGKDADLLALYRTLMPLSFIVAPLLGIAVLSVLPYQFIFLATGVIMLLGARSAFMLKDTR